jgi:hypothetical protein
MSKASGPKGKPSAAVERRYLNLLLNPLDKCRNYKPKLGTANSDGVTLEQFQHLYAEDPFYHWVGLDHPLMYAAHKAAGGMTSIYRQLGRGCENVFRAIVKDTFKLSDEEVNWSFEIEKKDTTKAVIKLDARIDVEHVRRTEKAEARLNEWLKRCGEYLQLPATRVKQLRGVIFETRQGYKSADAKRQNADLSFAMNAAAENYLTVLAIISTQASMAVIRRYKNSKMLVMTGVLGDDDTTSTYAFMRNVVQFELDSFFERNTVAMRKRCKAVLEALLSPQGGTGRRGPTA